ncbi:MAG TPA: hypothetical protein PKA63_14520 [Oligoflexia bacterium]|nr:hypothetical protein [Oligoflexia bacterium]HMP49880.1 hypothetical protein [Oligoflexia bacterium]
MPNTSQENSKTQKSCFLLFLSGFLLGISQITIFLGSLEIFNPFKKNNSDSGSYLLSSTKEGIYAGVISFVFISLFAISKRKNEHMAPDLANVIYFTYGITLSGLMLILSRWQFLPHAFLPDSIHAKTSFWLIPITVSLYPLIARNRILSSLLLLPFLILPFLFITQTKGNLLFSDDHGAVLYRLQLLADYFPRIPLYNTEWNAGMDWRDFFATGILNVYLIFYPLFHFFSVESVYNIVVTSVLFIILPFSTYLASRIVHFPREAALLSAIIAITASTSWYRWALSYGSMGFVCSTAIFPLLFALIVRTLSDKENTRKSILFALVATGTLCVFWSAQVLSLVPLILLATFQIKSLIKHARLRWTLIALLLINIPWMMLFVTVSKVGSFISAESTHNISSESLSDHHSKESGHKELSDSNNSNIVKGKKKTLNTKGILKTFRENVTKINPLILLLSLPSLLMLSLDPKRKYLIGYPLLLTTLWLLFLSTVVLNLKPQLELDRMMLISSILLSIPVGALIHQILSYVPELSDASNRYFKQLNLLTKRLAQASILSFIFLGIISTGSILQNRSWEKYQTMDNRLALLARLIEENRGNGRTLFAGFILHELGGGHIAPLSRLSGTPIIASSPVHNLWWYTDVIPEHYRKKGPAGIEEYLDLMNVSLVVTHERVWKNYFKNSSFRYEEAGSVDRFLAFRRINDNNSYFVNGDGKIISQSGDGLKLTLTSESAIIKFTYHPFLQVSNCDSINEFTQNSAISFISLEGCRINQEININSVSPFRRLFY